MHHHRNATKDKTCRQLKYWDCKNESQLDINKLNTRVANKQELRVV